MHEIVSAAVFYKTQVSGSSYQSDIFYMIATVCLLFVVAGIGLIDAGLVRRKNLLDTWIQKLVCSMVAAGAMALIGYAIWEIQYYEAFGIASPVTHALGGWWLGGPNVNTLSQHLNPATSPQADTFQVFMAFFVAYGAVGGALLHSVGLERVKAAPLYILSALAGGIVIPILLYYTWGSTSPLTNRGAHDYIGEFSLYIFMGVWALILAWRVGPRLGAFEPDSRTIGPIPHNMGLTAAGVAVILFAAPFAFLGCGYIVPGSGYFGISLTTSGFGIVAINIFMAYIGGTLAGALISYKTKNSIMILLGPVAGYISCGTSLDIALPWECFLIAAGGAFVVYGTFLLMYKIRIDDKKVVPLALGGGIYGALMGGIVGWGDKTGGYFGLKGVYAPQHATINLGWQALAVAVTVVIAGVSGLLFIFILEKTVGLRVTEHEELVGLDTTYWKAPPSPYDDVTIMEDGNNGNLGLGVTTAGALPGSLIDSSHEIPGVLRDPDGG